MKILLLEPFLTGSHRQWAEGYRQHSRHEVDILSLPGRHWKWRMYGGAVALAEQFLKLKYRPGLLLATDMLDLTTFLALTRSKSSGIPAAIYFHENQITYPWSPTDEDVKLERNNQYGFINYTSALAADRVFFNSDFHRNAFLDALPGFLKQFPDHHGLENVGRIARKSETLHLGMDLRHFLLFFEKRQDGPPVVLWNHRWEYDKNPQAFFDALLRLKAEGCDFRLVVLGEKFEKSPPVFTQIKNELAGQILHFGFAKDFENYARWLWRADILPVTSRQDFFGGSVVEAIFCDTFPILPKRLAYPGHLPERLHEQHFYENETEFYPMLKRAVQQVEQTRQFSGQDLMKKYDWGSLVETYDQVTSASAGAPSPDSTG